MSSSRLILFHSLRILTGLVFIISALFKLLSTRVFELYIFSQGLFSFNISAALARVIISGEFLLGALLVAGIYFKQIRNITFWVLAVFSAFLVVKIAGGDKENCNCFGDLIKVTPAESLAKNIALFIILFFAGKAPAVQFRFQKYMLAGLILCAGIIPTIIAPPDFIFQWDSPKQDFEKTSQLLKAYPEFNELPVASGKKLVCFFSVTCKYCEMASKKISVMSENHHWEENTIYIFAGNEKDLPEFLATGGSKEYPYLFIDARIFFRIAGPTVPSIFLIDKGQIVRQYNYNNINEKEIKDFFDE